MTRYNWEKRYEHLKAFLEKNKKYPTGASKNEEEKKLAKWCSLQRSYYKKGTLQEYPDRIKKLEEINFEWDIRTRGLWGIKYWQLKTFLEKHNRYPTVASKYGEERMLFKWCKNQRRDYREGTLQKYPDRINKLEEINFEFELNTQDNQWDEMCQKYVEFKMKYDREPSFVGNEDERKLSSWCDNQRSYYNKGILQKQPNRIKKLKGINFDLVLYTQWGEMYQKYVEFKDKHYREPNDLGDEDERKLAQWCNNQIMSYKGGTLKKYPERIKKLEYTNFEFSQWEEMYQKYVEFKSKHNREPYKGYEDERELEIWCGIQRANYKSGYLQKYPDRIEKLEEIGFEWITWEEMYQMYVEFKGKHNREPNFLVESEGKLAFWCNVQRLYYKKGNLQEHPDRIKKLKKIGFNFEFTQS